MAWIKICLLLLALIIKNIAELTIEEIDQKTNDISTGIGELKLNLTTIESTMLQKILNLTKDETQLKHKQSLLETKLSNVELINQNLQDSLTKALEKINKVQKNEEKINEKLDLLLETNKKLESNQHNNKNNIEEINKKLALSNEKNKNIIEEINETLTLLSERNTNNNREIINKLALLTESNEKIIEYKKNKDKEDNLLREEIKETLNTVNNLTFNIETVKKKLLKLTYDQQNINRSFDWIVSRQEIISKQQKAYEFEINKQIKDISDQIQTQINATSYKHDNLSALLNKTITNLKSNTRNLSERFNTEMMDNKKNYNNLSDFVNKQNIDIKTIEIKFKEMKNNEQTQNMKSELASTITLLSEKLNQNRNEIQKIQYNMSETINNSIIKFTSQIKNISKEMYKLNSKQNDFEKLAVRATDYAVNDTVKNDTRIDQIEKKINQTRNALNWFSMKVDVSFYKLKNNISEYIKKKFETEKLNTNKTIQQLRKEILDMKKEQNQNLNQIKMAQSTVSEQMEAINQNYLPELTSKTNHLEKLNNHLLLENLHKEVSELKVKQMYILTKINNSETLMSKFEDFKNKSSKNYFSLFFKTSVLKNNIKTINKKLNESSTNCLFGTNKTPVLKEIIEKEKEEKENPLKKFRKIDFEI